MKSCFWVKKGFYIKELAIFDVKFKKIKMKKIYFTLGLGVLFLGANAQQTFKIKNPIAKGNTHIASVKHANAERGNGHSSVSQLAGSLTCNTFYTAGSTMDLALTLNLTNTDAEYGDSLAITFPTGITPNTSTVNPNPFPNSLDAGGTADSLNPIAGQVISWGKNDNGKYGGIPSGLGAINFTVSVTITATVTGTQNANYFVSGDTYTTTGNPHGDVSGTFAIYPVGSALVDLTTTFVQPLNLASLTNCNYGTDTIFAQIKNKGTTTESNIMVMGSVNGGTAMMGTVLTATLAPGDSSFVIWLPAYNFSATNSYQLKAWTAQAGDISAANDTAKLTFANHQSIALTSTTYSNGIETAQDKADLGIQGTAAAYTGYSTGTFHSGAQALFTTVPTTATAGAYEVIISLPCMDVIAGETYRISYWRRTNTTSAGNGQSAIYTGLATSALTILKPYSANTVGSWTKDSADFTATATETRYFALGGQGTVSSTSQINCRFDDINVAKVTPLGIKTLVNNADLSMYPNPTTGVLNITTTAKATVEIYNMMGQNVATKEITTGANTIDISNLSNGVYSVQITQNNAVTVGKVIKTN